MKRVALYPRVSTFGQTVDNQERELMAAAERHGWNVAAVFKDEGISGAKGREKRPAFDRLCKAVTRREVEMVAAWSVDRLGRSLQDLVGFLAELQASRVDLYLHQQGLDTTCPSGRALFGMLGVFAEFERAMIVERTKAGMARAKAAGARIGRPAIPRQRCGRRSPAGSPRGLARIVWPRSWGWIVRLFGGMPFRAKELQGGLPFPLFRGVGVVLAFEDSKSCFTNPVHALESGLRAG
jgi:DNA invertase Pin-like site-specific DNA recombinase